MPMLPSGCGVDNNLTVDGHNEVDTISRGCSRLLALLAQRHHIINPGQFLTGGTPAARRGNRGTMSLQYRSPLTASLPLQRTIPEAGFRGGVYGDNMFAQKISSDVSSDTNEWSHSWENSKPKNNQKITINNSDGETKPFDRKELTMTG